MTVGENQSVRYSTYYEKLGGERIEQQRYTNKKGHNVNFKEEVQVIILEEEPTNRTQPSKEEDLNLDYASLGNTTQLSAQDDSDKTYPESILVTESNDSNGKHKETITPSMENEEQHADILLSSSDKAEDQKVAPPDVEQVHKNGEDKFLDAQNSNSKEDTGKSEVFESEAQYVEKIKELSQELNRRATQVDTLTRELENKSKKLHNAKKEVRKFSKAISELREEFTESTEKLVSAKEEEINKLKNQITQLTKELRGKKAQPAEEEKELQDLEKQLYELCFGEEISELALLTKGLEEERDLAVAQKLEQEESFKQAQQEINNLKEKLEREQKLHSDTAKKAHNQSRQYKAQLAEREKALINLNQELEQVIENFNGQIAKLKEEIDFILAQKLEQGDELQWTKAQLEQERDSANAQITEKDREISKLGGQVTKLTEENGQLREELGTTRTQLKTTVNNLNSEITQLTNEKSQLLKKLSNMQQNLKGSNIGNENKKLPVANDKSREQSNCASIAFVIAGTFAVVASLKTHYLAVWAALALPALVFFALGCHCLYKENTALNDVKVDQPNNQQLLKSSL